MVKKRKLTKFECGFICAMNTVAAGHGIGTEVGELWREIGKPTVAQVKASGMTEFDIDMVGRIIEIYGD